VAFEFRLPDIGEGLTEAEVVEWFAEPGDEVKLDQPLVQIETDKAVSDIPSPRAGVLLHQGRSAGSTVKVGELLAVIGEPGERWDSRDAESPQARREAAPIVGSILEDEGMPDVRALPLVRKLAAERGVDLTKIRGTGPGGRITSEDVEAASAVRAGREDRVRMSKLRRTIAQNMARSWREIPHVTTFGRADASALLAARRALGERRGRPIPWEALFIQAVVEPLRAHPEFNATLDGDELVVKRRYDVGFAVDTAEGLIVTVVRDAGVRDVIALAEETERLAQATRERTATAQELSGQTFTVSNIGAVGGEFGTPIIPYGTTAILSLGRIEEQPVAKAGQVEVRPVLPLSLSYDHRVIDGALGRRFLAAVIEQLERAELT
jgi:pyruvate dehydrogenase E2 component (dihydrolipoamide acetyltransferase)